MKIGQKLTIYTNKNYVAQPKKVVKKTTTASSNTGAKYYTIKKGDTLWDVANAKGLSVNELQKLNSTLNFKRLQPGMKIVVGAGS